MTRALRALKALVRRIVRAHRTGKLPEVGRAGHNRIYAVPEEVEMVRRFFEEEGKAHAPGHRATGM